MFVRGEEAVTIHHEKDPDDPRVAHTLTLEVDPYGVVTREATVVYESCALSFTPGILAEVYSSKVDTALLLAAGYEDRGVGSARGHLSTG